MVAGAYMLTRTPSFFNPCFICICICVCAQNKKNTHIYDFGESPRTRKKDQNKKNKKSTSPPFLERKEKKRNADEAFSLGGKKETNSIGRETSPRPPSSKEKKNSQIESNPLLQTVVFFFFFFFFFFPFFLLRSKARARAGGWGWGGLLVELKKKVVFRASLSIDRRKKQKDENESCNSLSH